MKTTTYTALPEPTKVVHIMSGQNEIFYLFPGPYGTTEGYRLSGLTKNNVPDKRVRGSRIGITKSASGNYYNGCYALIEQDRETKAEELRAQLREAQRQESIIRKAINELYLSTSTSK